MRILCFVAWLTVTAAFGQWPVSVDESKLRAVWKNNATVVVVAVSNHSQAPIRATLELAWLTPKDIVAQEGVREVVLTPGTADLEVALPCEDLSLWTRLRYRLTPTTVAARAFAPLSGFVALPQLASHVFELLVSQAGVARQGAPLTVHAQALHPVTRRPVAGVRWTAMLATGEAKLSPSATRPLEGGVREFVFDLPDRDELEIAIKAQGDGFHQETTLPLRLNDRPSARLQTDKPIYQPGQKLHLRAIVLSAQGRAMPDVPVSLRIDDESGARVHTAKLTASKFGVVSDSWEFPMSASLGEYRLALWQEDKPLAEHVVRVSRYELPTFRVTAKPDRSAYLPEQPVRVTIQGAYLFGKPVPKGRVKITRQGSNETLLEGTAGDDGVFTTVLDLAKDWAEGSRGYSRFKDVHFVASYRDPTSGRTEQRRFDVRLSDEPLHVYLRQGSSGQAYVTVSYADGRPAVATVEARIGKGVTKVTTNRYGVGKVLMRSTETGSILIRATDTTGLSGSRVAPGMREAPRDLFWENSRTIHRAGEATTLRLVSEASRPVDEFLLVHAIADGRRVASQVAHLVNHRGEVTFPYQADFHRTVVFAISGHPATKAVVYPDGADLRLKVTSDRASYRPGEPAALRMAVTSLDAKPVPAAIGVAVVDAAVLERSLTDKEFGQRSWFTCAFCRDENESEIGGVRLNDLYALKPTAAVSTELDLVAEALTAQEPATVASKTDEVLARHPSFVSITRQMEELKARLDRHYGETLEIPQEFADFNQVAGGRITVDPWGQPWAIGFGVKAENRFVEIRSNGPDKRAGTSDDFEAATFLRPYFLPLRQLILQILSTQVDYPATEAEFAALLRSQGILFETLLDPWGTPYRATVFTFGAQRQIQILSEGPDGLRGTSDDVGVATFHGTYFRREAEAISKALREKEPGPRTVAEFEEVLRRAGMELAQLRDPWRQPFRLTSRVSSQYGDRVSQITEQVFGGAARLQTLSAPVTRRFVTFTLRSDGPDGAHGTSDDFVAYEIPVLLAEESAASASLPAATPGTNLAGTGRTGTIVGLVSDASGGRIANAKVALVDVNLGYYVASTSSEGIFYFASIPPGLYNLTAESPGFRKYLLSQVPVLAGKTTDLSFELQVSSVTEAIEVSAQLTLLQTESASVSAPRSHTGTPRVREYFPETLVWLPELLTDAAGNARADLRLADSVTTWKIAAVASTLDGRMVETEAELRAFQPFFLELDPPNVLTDGDRVTLPVTVRNYQARAETVAVSLPAVTGMAILGPSSAKASVPASGSANISFPLQVNGARDKASIRVTAKASRESDAIEKSIRVHPDGREVSQTFGDLVVGRAEFAVSIPPTAIAGATHAELRLYPNLASVLLESADAILVAPHGCAEQTISAAYSNLIAWRFARATGVKNALVEKRALEHVRLGVQRLQGFRTSDQGIAYWRNAEPDLAVTAHALNFLVDAAALVTVDPDEVESLIRWLEQWLTANPVKYDHLAMLTARALAAAKRAGHTVSDAALGAVYHRLATASDQTQEPYLLANFILAALDSGDERLLGDAAQRLAKQARPERGGAYWDLQRNSPFFGWGSTGRYETTGLVTSALAAWHQRHPAAELDSAIRQGLYFLLRGRDSQGTWYSTQATVRAMQALTASSLAIATSDGPAQVLVNQRRLRSVSLPADPNSTDAVIVELALPAGENVIALEPVNGRLNLLTRLTVTHWLPWAQPPASPDLRLSVTHDRLSANLGERILCRVKAERVGFRGYGMMLAEIGLPPGADVDRGSLETASVDHYEIQPDRVVFYLWPKAGGVSFEFFFALRFPMVAKSARSVLYDYNNPQSRAEVQPVLWTVK